MIEIKGLFPEYKRKKKRPVLLISAGQSQKLPRFLAYMMIVMCPYLLMEIGFSSFP